MSVHSKTLPRMIPLASVVIAENVRTTTGLDTASIKELAESLKQHGLMQPIFVAQADDTFAVIAGQRRTLAAIEAGWTEIAAIVTDEKDTPELMAKQIVENLHRENLGLAETCAGVRNMLAMVGKPAEVAKRLNKSSAWVSKHLAPTGPNFAPAVRQLMTDGACGDLETLLMLHQVARYAVNGVGTQAEADRLIAQVRAGVIGRAKVKAALDNLKDAGNGDEPDGEEGGDGEGDGGEGQKSSKQQITVTLSAELHAMWEAVGGEKWLKRELKKKAEAQATLPV